jgi:hypothetical protein
MCRIPLSYPGIVCAFCSRKAKYRSADSHRNLLFFSCGVLQGLLLVAGSSGAQAVTGSCRCARAPRPSAPAGRVLLQGAVAFGHAPVPRRGELLPGGIRECGGARAATSSRAAADARRHVGACGPRRAPARQRTRGGGSGMDRHGHGILDSWSSSCACAEHALALLAGARGCGEEHGKRRGAR